MRPGSSSRLFLVAGLLIGLALALFVSPFASSSPDGLERVAEDEGFAESAGDHQLADSPLADYGVEGVDDERVATGVAGAVGVLLTFGIGVGLFGVLRALRPSEPADATTPADGGGDHGRLPSDRSSA